MKNSEIDTSHSSNKILYSLKTNPHTRIVEILDYNSERGFISLLGETLNEENNQKENFIIKLNKQSFTNCVDPVYWDKNILNYFAENPTNLTFNNDIYYKFISEIKEFSQVNVDLIIPVLKIDKYRKTNYKVVTETYKFYRNKIIPYISSLEKSHNQFIYNILYKGTEKIYYTKEKEFVILKDYKYINSNEMYFLGIVYDDSIKSLRDLTSKHLPLLRNLYCAKKEIEKIASELNNNKKYEDSFKVFIHYYPSFFHFHVHYSDANLDIDSTSINRAFDLNTIIQNISLIGDYYQKVDLDVCIKENSIIDKIYLE